MIKVKIIKDKNKISNIRINGHSGYAKHGEDIVCAAVSILTSTLANYLEKLNLSNKIYKQKTSITDDCCDENYDIIFCFENEFYNNEKAMAAIEFFMTGIIDIHNSYTEYVGLEIQEEQNDKT